MKSRSQYRALGAREFGGWVWDGTDDAESGKASHAVVDRGINGLWV